MAQQDNNTGAPPKVDTRPSGIAGVISQAHEQGATFNANPTEEKFSFWEDPQRVARYRNFVRSQPPNWEAPSFINRDELEAAYQYMKFRNNDAPVDRWKMLPQDDPGASYIRSMPQPPPEFQMPGDVNYAAQVQQPVENTDPFGSWDQLTPAERLYLGIFSPQPGTPGRPDSSRLGASAVAGGLGILPGAGLGALVAGPLGAVVGGAVTGVGTAYQAYTGNKIPILGNLLDVFNLLPEGAERTIGLVGQAQNQGLETILADLPAAWKAAHLTYETQQQDLLNLYAGAAHALGDPMKPAGEGEVWQISRGFAIPQPLTGPRGVQALNEFRKRYNQGEDALQLYAEYTQRFGDSGTFNDFVLQTLIDPTTVAEFGASRGAAGLAKAFGQERLGVALHEGSGSGLISALPPGARMIAEKLTGQHGPEGLITSLEKYRGWVQTGFFPGEVKRTPAANLSDFEKWAGGLTAEGQIKELQPATAASGIVSWGQYLASLTPAAKAEAFMGMAHDNLNVLFSLADSDPEKMVSILRQAAQIDPVALGEVGQAVMGSPVTSTVGQALRDVLKSNWDQDLLLRWTEAGEKRGLLEKTAQALGITAGEVLDDFERSPDALAKRIAAAGGPLGDAGALNEAFGIFTGHDALPWNPQQFQAQLSITIFDRMDQWLVDRYGITPDPAIFRLSQTLKGMQSLLLLGVNPAYFVNNQVNNIATRAATGVFGYMTPRQISGFLDRFGITPERLGEAIGQTGETSRGVVGSAARGNDWIAKLHKTVTETNNKLGLFSQFSNWGEKVESKNAYTIGMLKFWGKAWRRDMGFQKLPFQVEAMLDQQAPGVKDLIYQAVEAGMNMKEINQALLGETIKPQVSAVIQDAARTLFPDHPQAGVELLQSTGVQARLERLLDAAKTPEQINNAFDRVNTEIKAVVEETHKREMVHRAEDISNRVKNEGAPTILNTINDLQERLARTHARNDASAWSRATEYAVQTYAGILKGLNPTKAEDKPLIRLVTQAADDFRRFDKNRRKLADALRQAEPAKRRELQLKLDELYQAYNLKAAGTAQEIEARAAKAQPDRVIPTEQPTPGAAFTARELELQKIAQQYGLTDTTGRPVLRYLMNVVNRMQKEGEKFTDPNQIPLDVAEAALKRHQAANYGDVAERERTLTDAYKSIIDLADQRAREAKIRADGMLTRRMIREQLQEAFGANDSETEAALVLMDYHADQVARARGLTPGEAARDAWYATRIAGIVQGEDAQLYYNNYYQEAYGNLVAVHNLTEDSLLNADKLGGMPVPSIAVIKSDIPFTEYGDITLVGRRSMIDPREKPENRVFEADIFSPTKPLQVWAPVPTEKAQAFVYDRFKEADQRTGDYFTSNLWKYLVSEPDRNKALDEFSTRPAPMVQFLKENGIEVPVTMTRPNATFEYALQPVLFDWIKANYDKLQQEYRNSVGMVSFTRTEIYKEFEAKVHQAIIDHYNQNPNPEAAVAGAERAWASITGPDGKVSFNRYDQFMADYNRNKDGARPDTFAIGQQARRLLKDKGLQKKYQDWAASLLDSVFEIPKLKLNGELVDYNLNNIVSAMTSLPVRVGKVSEEFGPLQARARGATEFSSVQDMHRSEQRLVDPEEYTKAKDERDMYLRRFDDEIVNYADDHYQGITETLEDAMRAVGEYLSGQHQARNPEAMRAALEKHGFDAGEMDDYAIEVAMDAAEHIVGMPTKYFEAKPQRAVDFGEFVGAVIPHDTSPEVISALERRGIEYQFYPRDVDIDRQKAISKFYKKDDVLFQNATESRRIIQDIQDKGYIDFDALRQVFQGGTPAYLRGIVRFITEQRAKYNEGRMTSRDVAKAYLMTVSSQGSGEQPIRTVLASFKKAGVTFTRNGEPIDFKPYLVRVGITDKIRPEDVTGVWLTSDQGKAALDALERGEVSPEWQRFLEGRHVYGRYGNEPATDAYLGAWWIEKGARYQLGKQGQHTGGSKFNLSDIQELTDRINAAKGDANKIGEVVRTMAGIGEGKAGFIKHMLGFADELTVDTQEANFWGALVPEQFSEPFQYGNWGQVVPEIKGMIHDAFSQLRAEGVGVDIPPEVYDHVMHHWLWDYQKGQENHHVGLIEGQQLGQSAKGGVHFLRDGRAVIRALDAPDVSTMVHEIGHVFRRDLDAADMDAVARLGGLDSGAELAELENRFRRGEILPGDAAYKRYVQAEEMFARGWEKYLTEGDAPTPQLRTVFERFTNWMLDIYKRLRSTLDLRGYKRQVSGFENYAEFDNEATGSTINLTATVNGTNLKDIFDRLLVEKRQDDIEPLPEPTGPEPRTGPENDLVNGRLKDLPTQVQDEIKKIADQLITELSASRVVVNQDTHERAWEGPEWYRHLIDADRKVGGKGDDLKRKYMSALQSIATGRDRADAQATAEMKQIILERATGQSEIESNLQPAILRYMGDNETLFRVYGDQILSSEKPQLEAMFGAEWEKVVDEALLWSADQESQGTAEPYAPTANDITGQPVQPIAEPAPAAEGAAPNMLAQEAPQPEQQQAQQVPPEGTPAPEPFGSMLDEIQGEQLAPMMEAVRKNYLKKLNDRPAKFGELDPQAQAGVKDWLKKVEGDLASTKYAAMNYGQQMRDGALLNYSRRYGVDNLLELVFPYQFWYTRSMVNWAKRMIDKPTWYGMYARMMQEREKNAANMPERLRGKMRMPAPWLPEWAGGGLWFDPVSKLFPPATFGQPLEQYAQNASQVDSQAQKVISQWVQDETITSSEAAQALQSKAGAVWQKAQAQASADLDKGANPLSMLNLMSSPSLFWTAGNNILNGTPEKISPLPITRTAGAVQTALQGTALEGAGNAVGLLAAPERALRKGAGLSEFGEWGNYYVDRALANMAADGTISPDQAKFAMIERQGPVYDEAYRRVQYEQMLNVPGAAALNQAAGGSVIGTLEALPQALFGGTLFPTGELKLRGLSDDFKRAYQAKDAGNPDALNNFFAEHPEYEARLALNTSPDDRLRQFLVSELWDKYGQLEKPNRSAAANQLGDQFKDAFLNKETRSYDSIPIDTLARWNQMLGGAIPQTPETAPAIEAPASPVGLYAPELTGKIEAYQEERNNKFPNYYALQQLYYSVPETDKKGRKAILNRFPQLGQYWTWNKQYKAQHKDMQEYWSGTPGGSQAGARQAAPLTDKELRAVDPVLVRQVVAWTVGGQPLSGGAQSELQRLAKARNMSGEDYAHLILRSYLVMR